MYRLGTTNDFGRNLKITKKKHSSEKSERFDTGKINNEYFFNYIAATGVFTRTSYNTSRASKKLLGRFAYILNGAKELFSVKEFEASVYVGDKIIHDKFIYTSISNSYSIGGIGIFKKNELELNDGKFEVLLVSKPKNLFKLAMLTINILFKNHNDKNIVFLQTDNVKIKTKEKMDWTFDRRRFWQI